MDRATLYTDGACSGNPGPAGIGFVVLDAQGNEMLTESKSIGESTNNIAEYMALIRGLEACVKLGVSQLQVISDSELMVRQLIGRYKVKNPGLIPLYERAKSLAQNFEQIRFRHVLRAENARADELASAAVRR
ncbi:MAG TPA: ribonuclease H [Armatimonadetes bacterium]|nr:ribonuclease H [Armatimonadota bacterium]